MAKKKIGVTAGVSEEIIGQDLGEVLEVTESASVDTSEGEELRLVQLSEMAAVLLNEVQSEPDKVDEGMDVKEVFGRLKENADCGIDAAIYFIATLFKKTKREILNEEMGGMIAKTVITNLAIDACLSRDDSEIEKVIHVLAWAFDQFLETRTGLFGKLRKGREKTEAVKDFLREIQREVEDKLSNDGTTELTKDLEEMFDVFLNQIRNPDQSIELPVNVASLAAKWQIVLDYWVNLEGKSKIVASNKMTEVDSHILSSSPLARIFYLLSLVKAVKTDIKDLQEEECYSDGAARVEALKTWSDFVGGLNQRNREDKFPGGPFETAPMFGATSLSEIVTYGQLLKDEISDGHFFEDSNIENGVFAEAFDQFLKPVLDGYFENLRITKFGTQLKKLNKNEVQIKIVSDLFNHFSLTANLSPALRVLFYQAFYRQYKNSFVEAMENQMANIFEVDDDEEFDGKFSSLVELTLPLKNSDSLSWCRNVVERFQKIHLKFRDQKGLRNVKSLMKFAEKNQFWDVIERYIENEVLAIVGGLEVVNADEFNQKLAAILHGLWQILSESDPQQKVRYDNVERKILRRRKAESLAVLTVEDSQLEVSKSLVVSELEIDFKGRLSNQQFSQKFQFDLSVEAKLVPLDPMINGLCVQMSLDLAEEFQEPGMPLMGRKIKVEGNRLLSFIGVREYEIKNGGGESNKKIVTLYFNEQEHFDRIVIDYIDAEVEILGNSLSQAQQMFLKAAVLELYANCDDWKEQVNFDQAMKPLILEALGIEKANWSNLFVSRNLNGEGFNGGDVEVLAGEIEELKETELSSEDEFLGRNFDRAVACFECIEKDKAIDLSGDLKTVFEADLEKLLGELVGSIKRKEIPEGGVTILAESSEVREVCDSLEIFSPASSRRILERYHGVNPDGINHTDGRFLVQFSFKEDGVPYYFYGALVPPEDDQGDIGTVGTLSLYIYGIGPREDKPEVYQKVMILLERLALRGYMSWCCVNENEINYVGQSLKSDGSDSGRSTDAKIDLGTYSLPAPSRHIFYSLEKKVRGDAVVEEGVEKILGNNRLKEVVALDAYNLNALDGVPVFMNAMTREVLFGDFKEKLPGVTFASAYGKSNNVWFSGFQRPHVDTVFADCVADIRELEKALKDERFLRVNENPVHELYQHFSVSGVTVREKAKELIKTVFDTERNNETALGILCDGSDPFLSLDPRILAKLDNGQDAKGYLQKIFQRFGAGRSYSFENLLSILVDAPVVPHSSVRISNSGLSVYTLRFEGIDNPDEDYLDRYGSPHKFEDCVVTNEWMDRSKNEARLFIGTADSELKGKILDGMVQIVDGTAFVIQDSAGTNLKIIRQEKQSPRMKRVARMRQQVQYKHPDVSVSSLDDRSNTVAWKLLEFTDGTFGYVPIAYSEHYNGSDQRESSAKKMKKSLVRDGMIEEFVEELDGGQIKEFANPERYLSKAQIERLENEGIVGRKEIIAEDGGDATHAYVQLKQVKNGRVVILRSDKNYRQFVDSPLTHDVCVEHFLANSSAQRLEDLQRQIDDYQELLDEGPDDELAVELAGLVQLKLDIEADHSGYFQLKENVLTTALEVLMGIHR